MHEYKSILPRKIYFYLYYYLILWYLYYYFRSCTKGSITVISYLCNFNFFCFVMFYLFICVFCMYIVAMRLPSSLIFAYKYICNNVRICVEISLSASKLQCFGYTKPFISAWAFRKYICTGVYLIWTFLWFQMVKNFGLLDN